MGNRRVRHNRFFKIFTIIGASLGVISGTAFTVMMNMNMNGRDGWLTNELREYTARFVSEGSVISEATYRRGEEVEQPEPPEHEIDGDNNYLFIGWDTNGDNIIDFVPPRIYYSFTAKAVFVNTGKFDLSFIDLENMDIEKLLELMEKLNIDWEQFMDMFNIDPETLMDWLSKNAVLSFEADASNYISYFRSTSYGDYNFSKKKFDAPSFYDSSKISPGSVNPLSYTADKLQNAYSIGGVLPETFSFINYDINFNNKQDYYPVPDCEYVRSSDNQVDSDAHYLLKPEDNHYTTYAAYAPAFTQTVEMLRLIPFSSLTITQDEINYYKYALANYTNIPKEYEEIVDNIIVEHDWYEEDYTQIDSIGAYVENLGYCSLFKDGEVNLSYKKNKDPVRGLIENGYGSDLDFNVTAMMIFRRLNIPARIVKGYVVPGINEGYNEITLLQQHYWCEIYVKNVGWMICDCMNAEEFLGTNPYGELDKKNNPLTNEKILSSIKITTKPTKTKYKSDEPLDLSGMVVKAYYTDGSVETLKEEDYRVEGFKPWQYGEQEITVSYTEEYNESTVTKTDKFKIEIEAELQFVSFNFDDVKKSFYVTETLNTEGIVATGYYSDGSEKDLSNKIKVEGVPTDPEIGEHYEIVAIYDDGEKHFEDRYTMIIYDDEPIDFEITTLPTKLSYFTGDKFDSTGLVLTATYASGNIAELDLSACNLYGADDMSFYYPEDQHVITIEYVKQDSSTISQTFNVQIKPDQPTNMVLTGYKNSYTVGDGFNQTEFMNGKKPTVKLESGREIKDIELKDLIISTPDLANAGTSYVNIGTYCHLTYDDVYYDQDFEITVNNVDEKTYATQSYVPHAGPGYDMVAKDLFKYSTDYVGTLYFRNNFYNTYNPTTGWSQTYNDTYIQTFAHDKIAAVYQSNNVTVTYLDDLSHGVVPMYCSEDVPGAHNPVNNGSVANFTNVTSFELNQENYVRLSKYIDVGDMSQYRGIVQSNYMSLPTNSSYLQSFVNSYGISYDSTNPYNTVLYVKNILSNNYNFTYNVDYAHDPTRDPVETFLESRDGAAPQFASAAVLIYRYLGIPARYCTGFGSNSTGSEVTVTTNNAHAWAEVWLNGIGWVVVDPTGYDDGHLKDASGYYGTGFGGAGLYQHDYIHYADIVDMTYDFTGLSVKDDLYYFIYNGDSYYSMNGNSHKYSPVNSDNDSRLPSFLHYEITLENEYQSSTGEYILKPTIRVYDYALQEIYGTSPDLNTHDETGRYNYQIGTGKDGFKLLISPAIVYVKVTPKEDSYSLSENGGTVNLTYNDFTVTIDEELPTDVINFDYVITMANYSSASFTEAGIYSNYSGSIYLLFNGTSTDNVLIFAIYDKVVIEP